MVNCTLLFWEVSQSGSKAPNREQYMTDALTNFFFCLFSDAVLCEDGFLGFEDHCYKVFTSAQTYAQSQYLCASYGGYVAEIDSRSEQDLIEGKEPSI